MNSPTFVSRRKVLVGAGIGALALASARALAGPTLPELRIDYARYNPLSLVIRSRGLLERAFAPDGTAIRWVLSLGSNKALEFLNAGSIDIGSTAGAAALIGRINGNPIKSVGTFSKPEWTALVSLGSGAFAGPADLKGKRIAVTRGTDPHIFLVRALETAGLGERDVKLVLLQHPDGKTALLRGEVDAWAGLDPLMAQAEVENGARLFYRNPGFNSFGILNARQDFAKTNPEAVRRVLAVYEEARRWALANPADFQAILARETKLSDLVVAKQLERTDLSSTALGPAQRDVMLASGLALQKAGVVGSATDVTATVDALLDNSFSAGNG